jgi:hypothetical protein
VKTKEDDGKLPLVISAQVQHGEGPSNFVTMKSNGHSKMDGRSNSKAGNSSKLKKKYKAGVLVNQSARLFRREILKLLKKNKCKSRTMSKASKVLATNPSKSSNTSSSLVNKDLENWVVIHGRKELADEDVREIGKSLGVHYVGDKNNRFNLLTREGEESGGRREGVWWRRETGRVVWR